MAIEADGMGSSEPPVVDADRVLVAAVLAGAPGAFETLVRDYQRLCWHIINRMVRHPDDTRELCQDTFLRVHRYLHQYRFESPLKSWIGQVAYSVARRHLERKRIPIVEPVGDDDAPEPASSTSPTASISRPRAPTPSSARCCMPRSRRCRPCSGRC